MANLGHFDADTVDTEAGFDPVPPGDYQVIISDSEVRDVKDKPGQKFLKLEHTIVEGQYKDRKLYNNLNLWNANSTAVKIAEAHLGQICKALGKRQITDSTELHNQPFVAKVGVEAAKDGRNAQNRILKYYYQDEQKTGAPSQGAASAAPVTPGNAPWMQG